MADIFLSYATEDHKTATRLVKTLEEVGWSVFWDRVTPVGKSWDRVLEQQLAVAGAIAPLWSPNSVKSDWVLIEATEGMERRNLFPALIARERDTRIPIRFKLTEYADLSDWDGRRSHPGCARLLAALTNQLASDLRTPSQIAASEADLKFRRRREHHDVFLGYAREDHLKATRLAGALEEAGVAVWSDRAITVGESFADTIMSALAAARAVIILWTAAGVQSHWVRAEAQFAMNQGILIGVLADSVAIPSQFASAPVVEFVNWSGDLRDGHFQRILDSLAIVGVRTRLGSSSMAHALPTVAMTSEQSPRFRWIHMLAAAFLAGVTGAVLAFLLLRAV